ncbi:hypothetical protein SAY87_008535 [Trapa incisa]|uniref:MalT-like TPR region domain-containing protein n=1 Tax=Trapa incisa TaxID=236973 RepID=A0AAN7K0B9_9MYRT|nr:hypothetical protein SAY87_008535 [Trapa incisa]
MPGLALDASCSTDDPVGDSLSSLKERLSQQLTSISPLSPDTPRSDSIDLVIDGVLSTSIEELYHNVCEMRSSDGGSPSTKSFLSYGEESRIDSELCHLAGNFGGVEIMKQQTFVLSKEEQNNHGGRGSFMRRSTDQKKKPCELTQENPKKLQKSTYSPNSTPPSSRKNRDAAPRRQRNSPLSLPKLQKDKECLDGSEFDDNRPDLGPVLLKRTQEMVASGENPWKALDFAHRAVKYYEIYSDGESPNLELVLCLHIVAAIYCKLGQCSEAIPILERSIEIPFLEYGETHALAKFAGCMQLGDTYEMMGQMENAVLCYTAGLEIQRQFLGEKDKRVGATLRYVAEAHLQALQFDEARKLCNMALDIHRESSSLEEAADRRLMGLIHESMGNHEAALEHLILAGMAMSSNGRELDVAAIDRSIGDAYLSLSRYDEAACAYQQALTLFKSARGEKHPAVASVFIRLADLHNKVGKFKESKSYCDKALKIYGKPKPGILWEEIASGLIEVSAIYQSMNELEQALRLLKKALRIYRNAQGQQSTVAGIEAQMGAMYYMMGNYADCYDTLKASIVKFRESGEKKPALFGVALNQMGLACVQRCSINEAAELFEEARDILESEYGPYHSDTLGVYSNLAGTYDAMGRVDDAIQILEYVVGIREEKLGTANPDVDDEKRRLGEMLKEAGRVRKRKPRPLETLLGNYSRSCSINGNGTAVL